MFSTPPAWDLLLQEIINQKLRSSLFDTFMPLFSNPILLWLSAVAALFFLRSNTFKLVAGAAILCTGIGLSDLSCTIIKNYTGRFRPLHSITNTWYLDEGKWLQLPADNKTLPKKGSSFPSAHAANSAAAAAILFMLFRKKTIWFIPLIIGYSRIYLGKHFPLDVLAGWGLGLIIGAAMYIIYTRLSKHFDSSSSATDELS